MSFLNKTGLSYLWTKIKNYLTGAHVSTSVISGATTVDGALTNLQTKVGTATLTTTAKNLSGAVNELNSGLDAQSISITTLANTDTALESVIAIIVNGDTATQAVPAGGYAYIKNNTHGLTEGLYTAVSMFPATGGTADSTVFTAVSDGGLNAIRNSLYDTFTFSGTPTNTGFLVTNCPLQTHIPLVAFNASRNGWSYQFVEYNLVSTTYWAVYIATGTTHAASSDGVFSGSILAIRK